MNHLTKIAALPTGGGCQSALRPEDRGVERKTLAIGGPVAPGIAVPWADAPERFVITFTVGDVASREMVQRAAEASARRDRRLGECS